MFRHSSLYISLAGMTMFALLYVMATLYYPGGNQQDHTATGFSWTHNYWCNLLNENAINGKPNKARWWAFSAMMVLGVSLTLFWFQFAHRMLSETVLQPIVKLSVLCCIIIGCFTFTPLHDAVITISGLFGAVLIAITMHALYKSRWYALFAIGLIVVVLIAANNVLYYSQQLQQLPAIQKITFLCFLVWTGGIGFSMMQQQPHR